MFSLKTIFDGLAANVGAKTMPFHLPVKRFFDIVHNGSLSCRILQAFLIGPNEQALIGRTKVCQNRLLRKLNLSNHTESFGSLKSSFIVRPIPLGLSGLRKNNR